MYERNVLVQPGPLTVPRANRSLDEPSYRIVDFGRGWRVSPQNIKEAESEKYRARCEQLIPWAKHT
jgi:hypothetical protein